MTARPVSNCIVLGSGRSGTSMVAGMFHGAGYFMGTDLRPPTAANPRGFFEDARVNRVNEKLISRVTPERPKGIARHLFRSRPTQGQRWLSAVRPGTVISADQTLEREMHDLAARTPFCYKDPRFCYTLPAWRSLLGDAIFVCVFREPARTVQSILEDCGTATYLKNLRMTERRAMTVWTFMYEHVLKFHRHVGAWSFVHYDQVIDGSAGPRLSAFAGADLDLTFPDALLKRSRNIGRVPRRARETYEELCVLAGL